MRKQVLILLAAVLFSALSAGCVGSGSRESSEQAFPKNFPVVSAPSMITDPQEEFSYRACHFWNRYIDSSAVWGCHDDSTRVGGVKKDVLEQAFVEYARMLWNIPVSAGLDAQRNLMNRLEEAALRDTTVIRVFDALCSMAGECIYGVNSDYRNEELYIPVLEKLIETPLVTPLTVKILKDKYREELANCSKNRIGETAADFKYSTASGQTGTLYGVEGDFILLFFSNPGCSACLDIINSLKGSVAVSSLISSGTLKVLNIYIDEDLTEWFKYMPVYPKEWVNAYQPDLQVRREGIYDVRAIPSLYILDKEKRVVFKDVAPVMALSYLEHLPVI